MQTECLLIGGGLSGLTAAWQLSRAGVDVKLIEARNRFGGRVLTVAQQSGAMCDMGPSWFWPGQPLVASLLAHFDIPYYDQYANGATLFEQPNGSLVKALNTSPMAGSYRIGGGIGRLVDTIANEIDPADKLLGYAVTGLSIHDEMVVADCISPSGKTRIQARQVALAIPPRLIAELSFTPELPSGTVQTLTSTPTWMAGHAKFFALYERPFWREQGLCGSIISRRGPLAEIHDASPNSGQVFALFGFAGIDAESRTAMGQTEFIHRAKQQLAAIFGEEANDPIEVYFQDWSREEFTASLADRQPQTNHPQYGLTLHLGDFWESKLAFISSETSYSNGGLIEGALESGARYAKQITDLEMPIADVTAIPHKASMDWDWL
ncbi:MAG: NAD(P)/FAD-dependent oxidoreductase [Chloroflexota bacterium]